MLTGQVGICLDGTRGWPRIIQAVTRSRAHHVVVAVSETECLSAEPGGALIRPITYFGNAVWSQFPYTDLERMLIAGVGKSMDGHPYSAVAFVTVGLQFLTGQRLPAWLLRLVDAMPGAECAQLADRVLKFAGVDAFGGSRAPGVLWPGAWEKLFLSHDWPLSIT